ncbi:MAG: ketosteroid isomerase [Frondihabitans sp.]|nr:ketosteroid isomerase [Frondihabitans sp.]
MAELLPLAIERFISATNTKDSESFLLAFSDDAILPDSGREFSGKAAIARWNARESIGGNVSTPCLVWTRLATEFSPSRFG